MLLGTALSATLLVVALPGAAERGCVVEVSVGLEGVYFARVDGPALAAKPVDDGAPIQLRIAEASEDGSATVYELRFLATVKGSYDLCDYLMRADGQPIGDVQPMHVEIGELLPADHNGELEEIPRSETAPRWPYRRTASVMGVVWLVPLFWVVLRRITRRRAKPAVAEPAEPSLADQLRPLVEAAVAGRLSTAEQAQLELLLIAHWRRQLDLTGYSTAEALRRLRQHDESGELLRLLEQWLYLPPGESNVDVPAILRPYAHAEQIAAGALASRAGSPSAESPSAAEVAG